MTRMVNARQSDLESSIDWVGILGPLWLYRYLFYLSGNHDSDVDEFDESSIASSTPESTPGGSPTSTAALSGEDSGITSLSLSEAHGGFSDADFRSECTQSLDRAFEEGHAVENAAIELKTLRMASNVPLTAVKEVITAFLVSKTPLKDSDQATQKKAVNGMISRWGPLLSAIGSESPVENVLLLQVSI
jgi:translation initiation factor eIF-2B subunit epsilon